MRLALSCVPFVLTLALSAPAATPVLSKLTVVLDFKGPHSARSIQEMKNELRVILDGAGLELNWRSPEEATQSAVDNLVVVRFNGTCILQPVPYLYDERGPLAFTYTSAGELLPFSEVACDTVTASMRSAMVGGDYNKADVLLGRALGRVVAHELVHMLTRSADHSRAGIQKRALSGSELIADHLRLSQEDLLQLQQDHKE
jgi:hypothetical protein